jgi:hypothetical protein
LLVVEGAAGDVQLFGDVIRLAPGEVLLAQDDEGTPALVGGIRVAGTRLEAVESPSKDVPQGQSPADCRFLRAGSLTPGFHQR